MRLHRFQIMLYRRDCLRRIVKQDTRNPERFRSDGVARLIVNEQRFVWCHIKAVEGEAIHRWVGLCETNFSRDHYLVDELAEWKRFDEHSARIRPRIRRQRQLIVGTQPTQRFHRWIQILIDKMLALPLLIGIAFIHLYARLVVTAQTAVLETTSAWNSLRRSWQLTCYLPKRTLVLIMLIEICSVVLLLLPQIALFSSPDRLFEDPYDRWNTIYHLILAILLTPLTTTVFTVLYHDIRSRYEGADIAQHDKYVSGSGL